MASILYDAYSQVRYTSGTMLGSYGYTGQHDDTATNGLDYYGARYYDPTIGQFASADSLGSGYNRYAYVAGNPETKTDPTGHPIDCGVGGCGGGGNDTNNPPPPSNPQHPMPRNPPPPNPSHPTPPRPQGSPAQPAAHHLHGYALGSVDGHIASTATHHWDWGRALADIGLFALGLSIAEGAVTALIGYALNPEIEGLVGGILSVFGGTPLQVWTTGLAVALNGSR